MAGSLRALLSKFGTKSKDLEDELFNGDNYSICADKNSRDPNKAWSLRESTQHRKDLTVVDPSTPCKEGHVRFVCISDTHTIVEKAALSGQPAVDIPDGDVLLHTGDFTMYGTPDEVALFNNYMGTLPHKYKIVIAGNHDMTFDLDFIDRCRSTRIWRLNKKNYEDRLRANGVKNVHGMLKNCIYLQDSMVIVHGIKIYGAPWQPGSGKWGFNRNRGVPLLEKWDRIAKDTDILLTHGPPCGYGDNVAGGIMKSVFDPRSSREANHVGCVDLLNIVQKRIKPKYHVFGHIHEGYGMTTDGITTFVNASTCDENYKPINKPIVFDVPITNTRLGNTSGCSYSEFEWLVRTKLPNKQKRLYYDTVRFKDKALDKSDRDSVCEEDSSDDDDGTFSNNKNDNDDDSNDDEVCFQETDDMDKDKSDNNKCINDISAVFQHLDHGDKQSDRNSERMVKDITKEHDKVEDISKYTKVLNEVVESDNDDDEVCFEDTVD